MFAAEIKQLTGIDPLKNPCMLHYCKNFEAYNYKKDSAGHGTGAAGHEVIKLIENVAQMLQQSKFDKYIQGNFSALWDIYIADNEIDCEPIRKPFGSRKIINLVNANTATRDPISILITVQNNVFYLNIKFF